MGKKTNLVPESNLSKLCMYLFSTDKGWVKEAKKYIVPCLAAHKCSAYLWEYLPPAPLGSSFTSSTPQTESKVR